MRANLMKWLLAIFAACSLCAVNEVYAQGRVPTDSFTARVVLVNKPDGSADIHYWTPMIPNKAVLQELQYQNQGTIVQKLACFVKWGDTATLDLEKMRQYLELPSGTTASDWNAALQRVPMCDNFAMAGQVSRPQFYVLTRVPGNEQGRFRASTLRGDNPNTHYVIGGWGGVLSQLADEARDSLRITVPLVDTVTPVGPDSAVLLRPDRTRAQTTRRQGGTRVIYKLEELFLQHSGLDQADTHNLIEMLQNQQCEAIPLPPGTPYSKNTGIGVFGRNEYYSPERGVTFMVARCKLNSGLVVDILQYCTNVAYPLMGAKFVFNLKRPAPPALLKAILTINKEVGADATSNGPWSHNRFLGDARNEALYYYRVFVKNIGNTTATKVMVEDHPRGRIAILQGPLQTPDVVDIAPGQTVAFIVHAKYTGADRKDVASDTLGYWNIATAKGENTDLVQDSALVQAVFPKAGGGGGRFICFRSWWQGLICGCLAGTIGRLIVTQDLSVCGFKWWGGCGVENGNKPCEGPDPRFDRSFYHAAVQSLYVGVTQKTATHGRELKLGVKGDAVTKVVRLAGKVLHVQQLRR